MKIASGVTDQYVYFVAVDATDFTTRETGLSSFTVYRSRNGGAAVAMTTPTINEVDATNMPGVYKLLLDEDTTIDAGDDTQEMVLHITHSGMAPVTRTIELYRPKFTEGSTLDASAIASAVWDATMSSYVTSGTIGAFQLGTFTQASEANTNVQALNDLDAAGVRAAVGLASANLDTQLSAIPTSNPSAAAIADAVWTEAIADHSATVGSTAEALDNAGAAGTPPTASAIADAVWDEAIADHLTAGSTGASLNAPGGSGDPWVTVLPGSYTGSQAGKVLADILTDTGTTIPASISGLNNLSSADVAAELATYDPPTKAEMDAGFAALNDLDAAGVRAAVGLASANLDTQLGTIDTNAAAILVDTGTTIPGLIAALNDLDAAGIRTAIGLASADLDTQLAALPTAIENADALLNRDMSAVSDTNARSPLNALRFLRNRWSVSGTTLTVTKEDDSTSAWTATLTADASANPVVGSDPA